MKKFNWLIGWETATDKRESSPTLISSIGYFIVMLGIAIMSVPLSIILMGVIGGYLVWCLMFWLYEQLEKPIRVTWSHLAGFLVFCRNATPLISLLTVIGLLVGACGGNAVPGGVLGFLLGLFIEMVRQLEADASSGSGWRNHQHYAEREREEVGWGSEGDGFWYGGSTAYTPAPARQTTWNHGPIKVKAYRNPWAWQGFQASDGPREDKMRMDN